MADPQANDEVIRVHEINWENARQGYCQYNSLLRTRELTLYWPHESDEFMERSIRILDLYASSKNRSMQRYVEDPKASSEKFTGKWRVVNIRMAKEGEPRGIYAMLREGFATTLAADEARWEIVSGTPQTGDLVIRRRWINLDPRSAPSLAITANATKTVTNPAFEKDVEREQAALTATGTFAVSAVEADPAEDGSSSVVQTLSQISAISSITDLLAVPFVRSHENEILNLFGIHEGEGDYIVYTFSHLSVGSYAAVMGLSSANLLLYFPHCTITQSTSYLTIRAVPSTGWSYKDRKWDEKPDGTATLSVLFHLTSWTKRWTDKARMSESGVSSTVYGSGTSGINLRETDEATGLSAANAAIDWASAKAATDATRVVLMAELAERANGERVLRRQEGVVVATTTDSECRVYELQAGAGQMAKPIGRVWFRRSAAAAATLITAGGNAVKNFEYTAPATFGTYDAGTGGAQDYVHKDCRVSDNGDGTFDVYQTAMAAYGGTDTTDVKIDMVDAGLGNADMAVQRTWYRRKAAAVTTLTTPSTGAAVSSFALTLPATWGSGTTYSHSRLRLDDNFDGTVNVVQLGAVPNNIRGGRWTTSTEVVISSDLVALKISNGLAMKIYKRVVKRTIFGSSGDAWNYAKGSNAYMVEKDGETAWISDAAVKDLGNSKWAGFLTVLTAATDPGDVGTHIS